jgi:hypothetical protein
MFLGRTAQIGAKLAMPPREDTAGLAPKAAISPIAGEPDST